MSVYKTKGKCVKIIYINYISSSADLARSSLKFLYCDFAKYLTTINVRGTRRFSRICNIYSVLS